MDDNRDILLYFPAVKIMYSRLNTRLTPMLSYLYMFLGLWSLHFGVTVFPFMIYGYQVYIAYLFSDPTTNETVLLILNYVIEYTVMRRIYFANSKTPGKCKAILSLLVFDYIQYKLQLLWVKEGWFLLYTLADILSMYFYIYVYDRLSDITE